MYMHSKNNRIWFSVWDSLCAESRWKILIIWNLIELLKFSRWDSTYQMIKDKNNHWYIIIVLYIVFTQFDIWYHWKLDQMKYLWGETCKNRIFLVVSCACVLETHSIETNHKNTIEIKTIKLFIRFGFCHKCKQTLISNSSPLINFTHSIK